jgi:chitosanase
MTTPAPAHRRRLGKRTIAIVAGGGVLTAAGVVYAVLPASAATTPTATITRTSSWASGYGGSGTITNGGTGVVKGWKVEFDLPSGTSIRSAWNAVMTTKGQHYTLVNASWNGTIAAGASTSFGFTADGTALPTGCLINGVACSGVGSTPGSSEATVAPPTASPTVAPPTSVPPTKPTTPPVTPPTTTKPPAPPSGGSGLDSPAKKEIAMEIVSAAENSSLDWRAQFKYIEDIGDGRGYTAGIIGFCSGTGDMLELVQAYTATKPGNVLAKYLPALKKVNNSASHAGLDPNFTKDWKTAAADPVFQAAQESERDRVYFNPSVSAGKKDGVGALGEFAYYDASVVHGFDGFQSIRSRALKKAKPPSQGGNETTWLNAFLDERVVEMKKEEAHSDVTRIDTAQRLFLKAGNLDLHTPLKFSVYGDPYTISK